MLEENIFLEKLKKVANEWPSKGSPFSPGVCKAINAWTTSISRGLEEIEIDESFSDSAELEDFITIISKGLQRTFVYTARSGPVIDNLHDCLAYGCTLDGPCTITHTSFWNENIKEQITGLRFKIPKWQSLGSSQRKSD